MDKLLKSEINLKEEAIIKTILGESELQTFYYKKTSTAKLKMLVQKPADWQPGQKRTAVIWIHGGAWSGGEMEYMNPLCKYFALRGVVAFNIEYRLMNSKIIGQGNTVFTCLEDCKSAVRYIRKNAEAFGIDSEKIVVAGDSAGAHLACCLGTCNENNNSIDSYRVNAVINCNGIVDMTTKYKYIVPDTAEGEYGTTDYVESWMKHRKLAQEISPLFNIRHGQPPVLNLHGLKDETVEPEQAVRYHEKNIMAGNISDLILYPELRHAFILFNYREKAEDVFMALKNIDEWLAKLGLLAE